MTTMQALRARGADELAVEEVPVPEAGPHDVVIKVASAGIAPGIMRLMQMGIFKHLPTTLGHEAAGTIVEVGSEVTDRKVGDRVRMHPLLNCRDCEYCNSDRDMMCDQQALVGYAGFGNVMPLYEEYHDGALAEYVRVPYWLADPLADSISFDVGAKVHDLANGVRALKAGSLPPGASIVVTAASGTMGTAVAKLARHYNVARMILIGRETDRLAPVAALTEGVQTDVIGLDTLSREWVPNGELTGRVRQLVPQGVDAVIDFIPEGPVTAQTLATLKSGGSFVHMGASPTPLPLPPIALMMHCWRFIGTRAYTRADADDVLRLLESRELNIDELITHRFPLREAVKAVDAMQQRIDNPMWMTVINP